MAVQAKAFENLEGPEFVRSSEVEAVGEKVLELHGGIGGVPRLHPIAEAIRDGELSILWLLNERPWNDQAEDDQEPEVAGRCVKAPRIWHDVTGHDFAIWIRKHFWDEFGVELRRAVILHELLHIEVKRDKDNQPKFATRKHDVEDFVDVARQYGPSALAGDGGRYVRAAALFAGEPEPIGVKPSLTAAVGESLTDEQRAEIVKPLQDVADATGGSITISSADRSATITPKARKDQALADATAHRLGRSPAAPRGSAQAAARPATDERIGQLVCQGSNHVPGHTEGCPRFGQS